MGMGDFRIAGGLLPRMHSVPGPSRLPSALSRNAVLHTGPHLFPPSFQRLHPHSFIPHPCSSPSPPSTSCPLSPSPPITLTLLLAVLSRLPEGWSLHFALSHPSPQIRTFHLFPTFLVHHLSILVFTPSHSTYVFLQFPTCHR